jgi:hypothetical protein
MLKSGDEITVRYSQQLVKAGNNTLVNRTGIVSDLVMSDGVVIGVKANVRVVKRNRNYFIPIDSIDGIEDVNKIRTLSILKSTIL